MIDAIDGAIKLPDAFFTTAIGRSFCFAYASSTYPIVPGVCFTCPATPSLPLAPTPTAAGHFTAVPLPTLSAQMGLMLLK